MRKEKEFHRAARAALVERIHGMDRALSLYKEGSRETDDEALLPSDVLSLRTRVCLDLELSWGGPSDWVRVYLEEGCISDVEYHYRDWFHHESVHLPVKEYETVVAWARDVVMVGALAEQRDKTAP